MFFFWVDVVIPLSPLPFHLYYDHLSLLCCVSNESHFHRLKIFMLQGLKSETGKRNEIECGRQHRQVSEIEWERKKRVSQINYLFYVRILFLDSKLMEFIKIFGREKYQRARWFVSIFVYFWMGIQVYQAIAQMKTKFLISILCFVFIHF